tara:strand:- start:601 stop:1743 length:1143 start_codon:yes stop_codon:yes gene_type:complete
MNKKLIVVTVVGTRPEIIRLSRVIYALNESKSINHILIHTGQNYDYELNQIFFDNFNIPKPNYFLNAAGGSASSTIGNIISSVEKILVEINPDAFLVLGDTNSCLCAIPAKKLKIPVFHMEAGNRCFDQRVPEETNRKIVDHIADVNLTYSDIAREYLLREGISPQKIIKTGSPMFEVLNHNLTAIKKSDILDRLNLKPNEYFVVSAHREENIEDKNNFNNLINTLNIIAKKYNFPIILSTHPRTNNKINELDVKFHSNIIISKPLGYFDYNKLQLNSFMVLSDSGTISEESSILNFKALNIREAHERPEAMEEASVVMTGLNSNTILNSIEHVKNQKTFEKRSINLVQDYAKNNVAEKVVRIILSYTGYINKFTWLKEF